MLSVRVALAQINVTVGDIAGNEQRILQAIRQAQSWMADVVVVPELAITGYPPEDLLLKQSFIEANLTALKHITPLTRGLVAVVGFVNPQGAHRLYNAAAILVDGRHTATYHKRYLPNYGVFDERRYFSAGTKTTLLKIGGFCVGVAICEDLWEEEPCRRMASEGAQWVLGLSASPYHAGKLKQRQRLFGVRARENSLAIAACNLVGGQDELVFDGSSFILDAHGRLLCQGRQCEEDMLVVDLFTEQLGPVRRDKPSAKRVHCRVKDSPYHPPVRSPVVQIKPRVLGAVEEIYTALTLGVRDYVHKNTFDTVILGISGGIDSALTSCIAVDALGPKHVVGLIMPSRYSSKETQEDAKDLAQNLGIRWHEVSIEQIFNAYLDVVHRLTRPGHRSPAASLEVSKEALGLTEQNIQARIRGNLLMALSNSFGYLVLTTGNKSEMATGYTTLYGDMAGGFAVIKDVPKMLVYHLARFRNQRERNAVIPEGVFKRPPTAELAPSQTDQQTLPPYDLLDRILKAYVEEDLSLKEIVQRDHVSWQTLRRVVQMVDRSEYKRRQGPPGIKITPKAFGKDRRMPITNRFQQD